MDHTQSSWAAQASAPEKLSELYIRDSPYRSIAIVSSSHVLVLRYSSSASSDTPQNGSVTSLHSIKSRGGVDSHAAKCMVEFAPISSQLLKDYRPLSLMPVYGTLGLISANGEVFLSVITQAKRAATIRPGETVEKIATVDFYCLSSADYDDVVPLEPQESDFSDTMSTYSSQSGYGQSLSRREVAVEHPCHELRKLLSNGSFYYSTDFDVTNRLQDRSINPNSFDIDNFDDTYLWNSFMIRPLVEFRSRLMPPEREALDSSRILTSAIRGFCSTVTIPQRASPLREPRNGMPSYMSLISRLSCRRAGTRFNSRGIDDDGYVANFVETETIFCSPAGTLFSYVQVRGSVPVFWEQAADLLPGRQKIAITRSPEGTQPAFNKHFEDLEHIYGAVHIINLLSDTKPAEVELSTLYRNAIRHSPYSQSSGGSAEHALLRETHYDFHAETKGPAGYEAAKDIRRYIEESTDGFAYFLAEKTDDPADKTGETNSGRMVVVLQQDGVFRTNCLDCLDRTNLIQTLISQMAVESFLAHRSDYAASDFWANHANLWADNGDSLSKIYAGTGALKSSFTRHGKMSLAGAMADVRKSVQRIYHNNFVDPSRQVTIDMLLGRLMGQAPVHLFDPISDFVSIELSKRSNEFTSSETITIWTGTFNLNGRTDGIGHDLSPWLFGPSPGVEQPEIYVVAFQEIVELSPQQIMNSDPSRKHLWEEAVKRTLNDRQARLGGDRYVLLRSGQLVGAALCIFVKTSVLKNIKNVEGSVKKTGLSGMAGNKGAVAIRFDYANTQICFVTAHLAAGFSNYDERNRDYTTIHHGLRFQRNRGIEDHDAIIWMGDFNYRIGLGLETAKALVKKQDLETLYENDQLNLQMVAGLSFPFYSEARINFMPTYKFDVGSDTYDSSEKARIPAWTDRILRKGANLRQTSYDSAPLKFSDHRPVYATFECKVNIVDEKKRENISRELYQRRKADVGDPTAHLGDGEESDDEDLIGYDSIEPGLPPASSDRQKWWLENRQPARAQVAAPHGRDGLPMALNPNRPSNPFGQSEEPDWVSVPRSSPGYSSISSSPYEKVSLPKAMAERAAAVSRKQLPIPYEPSTLPAQVGRLRLDDEQSISSQSDTGKSATPPPPPPPPRRQTASSRLSTSASATTTQGFGLDRTQTLPALPTTPGSAPVATQASQVSQLSQQLAGKSGKSPPPVGKKPAHLAAGSPLSKTTTGSTMSTSARSEAATPARPARSASTTSQVSQQASLARKAVSVAPQQKSGESQSATAIVGGGQGGERKGAAGTAGHANGFKPPLPSRHGQEAAGSSASVDLLDSTDDDGGEGIGGWEALQPSSKQ
ncbi:Inositol-1,4,5-trisphosphate 5-phosphatase 1 [Metarhizium acridum]|uniref:phosphoinositide 5-phosphatase n=1 Tax=Metarhizium acridum (strain CQMa 102) TaxID=655827 RepID=E9DSD9_METAQ|nr:SacI domain and endonuclease/exonuclease/phosphatase [Metarhizium acridum CQMa 102]EFY93299.1 SacI domain and endonuclease/exonuclease/phosphatase [Metarhizium acridum CQMa 102]KAG8416828.1 Inositol-1,4,5-trisphosphate 5-phosphatase 1 [Metarhizium acridum]